MAPAYIFLTPLSQQNPETIMQNPDALVGHVMSPFSFLIFGFLLSLVVEYLAHQLLA